MSNLYKRSIVIECLCYSLALSLSIKLIDDGWTHAWTIDMCQEMKRFACENNAPPGHNHEGNTLITWSGAPTISISRSILFTFTIWVTESRFLQLRAKVAGKPDRNLIYCFENRKLWRNRQKHLKQAYFPSLSLNSNNNSFNFISKILFCS